MSSNRSFNPIALLLVVVFVAGAGFVLFMLPSGDQIPAARPSIAKPEPATTRDAASEPMVDETDAVVRNITADFALLFGEKTTLKASDLPKDRPVVLGVVLPVSSTNLQPLRVRIVGETGRMVALKALVQDGEPQSANLEVAQGWLTPGTYLLHVSTNEATHLPLRRYVLEIR